jgi:hypothetical protein
MTPQRVNFSLARVSPVCQNIFAICVWRQEIGQMTNREIKGYMTELRHILAAHGDGTGDAGAQETIVSKQLRSLAVKTGASLSIAWGTKDRPATPSELAYNIHQALQTASMIDACRTAAKNAKLTRDALEETRKAQRTSWIIAIATVIAALAALGGMAAAWTAAR